MTTPISKSATPVVFDTLPALKVRHYHGRSALGNIYTFARLYVLEHSLAISLCSFEESPPPQSRVAFCVGEAAGRFLRLALSPEEATLTLCGTPKEEPLPAPAPSYFSGQDEQGWYWGAHLLLAPSLLEKAGVDFADDEHFCAALVKYRTDEDAFGSAFPVQNGANPFDIAHFGSFAVVGY